MKQLNKGIKKVDLDMGKSKTDDSRFINSDYDNYIIIPQNKTKDSQNNLINFNNVFFCTDSLERDTDTLIITERLEDSTAVIENTGYSSITLNSLNYDHIQEKILIDLLNDDVCKNNDNSLKFKKMYLIFNETGDHSIKGKRYKLLNNLSNLMIKSQINADVRIGYIGGCYIEWLENKEFDLFTCHTLEDVFKAKKSKTLDICPEDYYSFSELLEDSESILIRKTNQILRVTNSKNKNFEIAKKFINDLKLWLDRELLINYYDDLQQIDYYQHYFDDLIIERYVRLHKKDVEKLKKIIDEKPNPSLIKNRMLNKYDLMYKPNNNKFYIYTNSVWQIISYTGIRQLIQKELGEYETPYLLNQTTSLIQASVNVENLEFNKKPLLVFNNGTLDLNTGKLRNTSKDDLVTIKLNYDYNPDLDCPIFKSFLNEITDNNPDRYKAILDMMSYILFEENSQQIFFYLYGEPSSGKSTLLEIIKLLFNRENCSYLSIRDFNNRFNIPLLENKLVNIDDEEMHPNLSTPPNQFINFVNGVEINSENKGVDVRSVRLRTKEIIASNYELIVNEIPDRILRRLVVIDFPLKFVKTNPKHEYERIIEPHKERKMIPELGGIFNLVFNNYLELKAQIKQNKPVFIYSRNDQLKEIIKNNSDEMLTFIIEEKEALLKKIFENKYRRIEFKEVYEIYQNYIDTHNIKPEKIFEHNRVFKNSFSSKFRAYFPFFERLDSNHKYGVKLQNNVKQVYTSYEEYLKYLDELNK